MDDKRLFGGVAAVAVLSIAIGLLAPAGFLQSNWTHISVAIVAVALVFWLRAVRKNDQNVRTERVFDHQQRSLFWVGSGLVLCAVLWLAVTLTIFSSYAIPPAKGAVFVILPAVLLLVAGASALVYWIISRLFR